MRDDMRWWEMTWDDEKLYDVVVWYEVEGMQRERDRIRYDEARRHEIPSDWPAPSRHSYFAKSTYWHLSWWSTVQCNFVFQWFYSSGNSKGRLGEAAGAEVCGESAAQNSHVAATWKSKSRNNMRLCHMFALKLISKMRPRLYKKHACK